MGGRKGRAARVLFSGMRRDLQDSMSRFDCPESAFVAGRLRDIGLFTVRVGRVPRKLVALLGRARIPGAFG
jgi:hypothetical protein